MEAEEKVKAEREEGVTKMMRLLAGARNIGAMGALVDEGGV